jgi:hypothetical protein
MQLGGGRGGRADSAAAPNVLNSWPQASETKACHGKGASATTPANGIGPPHHGSCRLGLGAFRVALWGVSAPDVLAKPGLPII